MSERVMALRSRSSVATVTALAVFMSSVGAGTQPAFAQWGTSSPPPAAAPLAPASLLTAEAAGRLPDYRAQLGITFGAETEYFTLRSTGQSYVRFLVSEILPDTVAARADLRAGDRIVRLDDYVFDRNETFVAYVRSRPPNQPMVVHYVPAEDQTRIARVALFLPSAPPPMAAPRPQSPPPQYYGGAPSAPPPSSGPTTGQMLFGLALGAIVVCGIFGCARNSGSSSGSGGGGRSGGDSNTYLEDAEIRRQQRVPSYGGNSDSGSTRPDTSAGCGWGDRAYGTCSTP